VTIARIALPVAAAGAFDYWIPAGLTVQPGAVVRVRLARRILTGVVVAVVSQSDVPHEKLHPIVEIRQDVPPLPADILEVADFVARYYQEPLGLVPAQMLPPLAAAAPRVRAARKTAVMDGAGVAEAARSKPLNPDQQNAASAIISAAGSFAPFLLQGVTGSGKTEVYLAAAAECMAPADRC
jgi:primosomal protein N' (replication factor Y)